MDENSISWITAYETIAKYFWENKEEYAKIWDIFWKKQDKDWCFGKFIGLLTKGSGKKEDKDAINEICMIFYNDTDRESPKKPGQISIKPSPFVLTSFYNGNFITGKDYKNIWTDIVLTLINNITNNNYNKIEIPSDSICHFAYQYQANFYKYLCQEFEKDNNNNTKKNIFWNFLEYFYDTEKNSNGIYESLNANIDKIKGFNIAHFTGFLHNIKPSEWLPFDDAIENYLKRQAKQERENKIKDYAQLMDAVKKEAKDTGKTINELYCEAKQENEKEKKNNKKNIKDNKMNNMEKLIKKLKSNGQLILTGAPGTGKTYATEQIAAWILCGKGPLIPDSLRKAHEELKKAREAVENKEELEKAREAVENKNATSEQQQLVSCYELASRYEFVQFHPGYDYSDFVEGLKPENAEANQITFVRKNGIFMNFCEEARKKLDQPYIFVIDEINRADLSRVFGELFYGLEEDYRGKTIRTQYSYLRKEDEADFVIPPNVYIIGTMNDIDRSVESMDFALRRRFAWHEITAYDSMAILNAWLNENTAKTAAAKMTAINQYIGPWGNPIEPVKELTLDDKKISLNLGREYQLGGAYFKKIIKYQLSDKLYDYDWEALWCNHIEVILREYLRGRKDAEKILEALKSEYDKAGDAGNVQQNTDKKEEEENISSASSGDNAQ